MYLLRKNSSIQLPLWVLVFPAWKEIFKSSNRVQRFWKGERFLYWLELCAVLHTVEHTAKLIYLKDVDPFLLFSNWPSISVQGKQISKRFYCFFLLPFHTDLSCKILGWDQAAVAFWPQVRCPAAVCIFLLIAVFVQAREMLMGVVWDLNNPLVWQLL